MTRFDRYLIRTLFMTTLISVTFLLIIDFLLQSADQASDIGQNNYTVAIMVVSQIYQLPEKLLLFAPAATLIGAIMGLGQLASQNEIAIVLASGVSRLRLVRGGLILATIIGLCLLLLGESTAPRLAAKGELLRSQALGQSATLTAQEGMWLNDHGTMTRIGNVNPDGSISDLLRITPEKNQTTIQQANKATYENGRWLLTDSRSLTIDKDNASPKPGATEWSNNIAPQDISYLFQQNSHPGLIERYRQIQFLKNNGLNYQEHSLAFWQKLFLPLTILTMVLLALPLAFSRGRSAHQGTRLVIGILLGVAFYICQGILTNFALILGWPPFLGALLPIIIFAIPALIVLKG
ncbi:LPS export ABC transporter permease LptG [Cardiobacteriaceae bacterium TAE3-ERU3]|nr:LPS export ABC transporter permease LptG [Cardiobacteriaceae bacterium TAE3-ERU3]